MGRGVLIPKFGLFTFSAPEFKLEVPSLIISNRVSRTRRSGTSSHECLCLSSRRSSLRLAT
jgi:hypothetical protein